MYETWAAPCQQIENNFITFALLIRKLNLLTYFFLLDFSFIFRFFLYSNKFYQIYTRKWKSNFLTTDILRLQSHISWIIKWSGIVGVTIYHSICILATSIRSINLWTSLSLRSVLLITYFEGTILFWNSSAKVFTSTFKSFIIHLPSISVYGMQELVWEDQTV